MIAWLSPIALLGLLGVAGPIVVHLLRQARAERQPFPSLRFVPPERRVATYFRRVSDPWLLLVRIAIVACAAAALAQPVILFPARVDAWNRRVARAIVVDTSDSMRRDGSERAAREAAGAESNTAFAAQRFEGADLAGAIRDASAWLRSAPPARRELLIVSDFQSGALSAQDLAAIEPHAGIRTTAVGRPPEERRFAGTRLAGSGRVQDVRLTQRSTDVSIGRDEEAPGGLRILAASADAEAVGRLLRTVASAETPAPSLEQPLTVVFPGGPSAGPLEAVGPAWMRRVAVRVTDDGEVRKAAGQAKAQPADLQGPWLVLVRDAAGQPLVRAASSGDALVLHVAGDPAGYLAAAVLRASLVARPDPSAYAEQEIAPASAATVASWSREPRPVGREVALHAERTDARWFWAAALVLLLVESRARRSRTDAQPEAHADAA